MPIYEYECTKCGARHEAWQKMSDKPLKKCEACSGKLQKLISQSTFHLKGAGWYATDYAGKSTGNEPTTSSTSEDNTQKLSSEKPKTAAKKETKKE